MITSITDLKPFTIDEIKFVIKMKDGTFYAGTETMFGDFDNAWRYQSTIVWSEAEAIGGEVLMLINDSVFNFVGYVHKPAH